MYWDGFDYECAQENNLFLSETQKKHLDNLMIFQRVDTKKERYNSDYLYHFIIDRLLSAKRRVFVETSPAEYKGEYHDAIFRYAQCLEILIETYITRKVLNYDPDVKCKSIYSISGKRELVFKGRKKSEKDNDDNRIDFQMEPIDDPENNLRKKTKNLSDRRDDFAHVRMQKKKSYIQEAEEVIIRFMEIVFEKKSEIIEHDLDEYAFYKYFDDFGTLCKS